MQEAIYAAYDYDASRLGRAYEGVFFTMTFVESGNGGLRFLSENLVTSEKTSDEVAEIFDLDIIRDEAILDIEEMVEMWSATAALKAMTLVELLRHYAGENRQSQLSVLMGE